MFFPCKDCSDQPCKNGAFCLIREFIQSVNRTVIGRFCFCPKGFNGIRCEKKIPNPSNRK